MQRSLAILATVVLTLADLGMLTHAAERGPKSKGDGAKAAKAMQPAGDLDLTPEQKQKMEQIHQAAATQAGPFHKELGAKMKEMQALWAVDKPDRAAIEKKHAEMAAIHAKLWGAHIDAKLQIHGLLTPEQRSKWAAHHPMVPGMHGPGMETTGMHGGGCAGTHGGGCPGMAAGDCPCMRGAGADKGPGCPHAVGHGKAAADKK